jgi:hypothetical protein
MLSLPSWAAASVLETKDLRLSTFLTPEAIRPRTWKRRLLRSASLEATGSGFASTYFLISSLTFLLPLATMMPNPTSS